MKKGSQTIFMIIGGLVVLGGLGYVILNNNKEDVPEGLVSEATGGLATPLVSVQSDASLARDELLVLLQSVSRVSLDVSLLDAVSFTALKDIGILLPPVSSQGRSNPFAPYTGTTVKIIEQPIIETPPVDNPEEGGDDILPLF